MSVRGVALVILIAVIDGIKDLLLVVLCRVEIPLFSGVGVLLRYCFWRSLRAVALMGTLTLFDWMAVAFVSPVLITEYN